MAVLAEFDVDDLVTASAFIRSLGRTVPTMEQVAGSVTRYLFETLVTTDGASACALVRFYKTHRFADLPADLQEFARRDAAVGSDTRCLTLLATAGAVEAWNDRRRSRQHQAIPLASADVVAQSPMIAAMIDDFGMEIEAVVAPDPALILDRHHGDYNVFFVPDARTSRSVPAKDFVAEYDIRSVIGFGGFLPNGDLFGVILFTNVTVPARVADLFRSLALSVKAAIVPHTFNVFV
jgi:hypothetical protein